jgi:homoserine dehydrogenase
VRYARELGYRIKLLAMVRRDADEVEVRVHPALVPLDHMLASVGHVYNAVLVQGDLTGETLYYGRGAGRDPTASTVIGDIADIAGNLASRSGRPRRGVPQAGRPLRIRPLDDVRSRCYLRLMVRDRPGMLGRFSSILGLHGVSIAAVVQKAVQRAGDHVPVVTLTHEAREADVTAALTEILAAGIVNEPPARLRLAEG